MSASKYVEIGRITLNNSLIYFSDFMMSSAFIGIIIFIFIQLWKAIYSGGSGLIEGFSINMMVWYLVMTESIVVAPGKVIEDIGNEVKSGNIAQHLNRPYNYMLFKYAAGLSPMLLKFFTVFTIGSIVTTIFIGGIGVEPLSLIAIAVCVFLAISLNFLMMALIGVFALWLEDAEALHFIYQKIVFVIGGMLVPLEIFPEWLESISRVLPFSYTAYHPAKLFVMFDWGSAFRVVLAQLGWIAAMIVGIYFVYRLCIKRISINGG